MNDKKIAFFDIYCPRCVHFKDSETDDPCNECLTYGGKIDSHKPINYEQSDISESKLAERIQKLKEGKVNNG
jgi:hypothetical protein